MKLPPFVRATDGPFTRELEKVPGPGGLGLVPRRVAPGSTVNAVCGYCATGCSLAVHVRDGEAVNLTPARGYPVNLGMGCPKGWEALTPLTGLGRATRPLVRDAGGVMRAVTWECALREMRERLAGIVAKHGPESVAFLSTGQIPTEEMLALGMLTKFGMGWLHGDGNTRQCMATAVTAYKESFGFDAPPYTYADFEQSDVIVLVGSNLCIAHPILWQRVLRNPGRPAVVVIDPRRTETAEAATHHYAVKPKGDLALFHALARELAELGAVDRAFVEAHTSGYAAWMEQVSSCAPQSVEEATGLAPGRVRELAALIAGGKRVSFWWTMGVNQSHQGVRTAQAIINVALMTGNVGRPGTGANSITGQCNAMGSRLYSNTTCLPGGRDFTNATHRREVADVLGIDVGRVPDRAGLAYDGIMEGVATGRIRGLWVVATNPAHSWIDQGAAVRALRGLECLVVQDMYETTETARLAHVLLPAAGWGEKEGSFINSERRLGRVRAVARAPGEARTDYDIFRAVAAEWGCGELFVGRETPERMFATLRAFSRGRPCDVTGVADLEELDTRGGVQWPWDEAAARAGEPAAERRLFEDGRFFHADGRARFVFGAPVELPEPAGGEYPLHLLTGRGSSAQWHTQTRTGKCPMLTRLHAAGLWVELHPEDARRQGFVSDQRVRVVSRRGEARARVVVTTAVPVGHVFLPMHNEETNRLTQAVFDPHSRQPAYKAGAVRLEVE
jgi:assimilatory nitrate reductase catalytic subunit